VITEHGLESVGGDRIEVVQRVFATNIVLTALACASVLWPGPLTTVVALGGGSALVGCLLWSFARGKL
jgi:hypothetical protein